MSLGTGPARLVEYFEENWQATRVGRADVTPMYNPEQDYRAQKDVVVPLENREESGVSRQNHDILHFYHPDANPPDTDDNGYKEVREVETVQLDIELTDRTDHSRPQGEQRLSARERMTGSRDDLATPGQAPYPGIQGEAMYVLETIRRGLDEWDRVNHTVVNENLGNSNANVSYSIELIQEARNTVQ